MGLARIPSSLPRKGTLASSTGFGEIISGQATLSSIAAARERLRWNVTPHTLQSHRWWLIVVASQAIARFRRSWEIPLRLFFWPILIGRLEHLLGILLRWMN